MNVHVATDIGLGVDVLIQIHGLLYDRDVFNKIIRMHLFQKHGFITRQRLLL